MRHHADLLTPVFWQEHQRAIAEGRLGEVFPYERSRHLAPD
jgi:isocitrate dehydrogenase kinase/phosphatase